MKRGGRGPALAVLAVAVGGLHLWLLQGLPVPQPGSVRQPAALRLRTLGGAAEPSEAPRPAATPIVRSQLASAGRATPAPAAPRPPHPSALEAGSAATPVALPAAAVRAEASATWQTVSDTAHAPTGTVATGFIPVADAPRTTPTAEPLVLPPPLRLHYRLRAHSKGLELPGTAELTWRLNGSAYTLDLSLNAPPLPARTQQSVGHITAEGLAPERFSERRRGEQATHFDRANGRVVFSNNRPSAELPPDAQDRLSVLLQLGAVLAARPPQARGHGRIVLPVAGTGDIEPWEFELQGQERLHLPGGELAAWRLVRLPRQEHDQKVELWIAPGLDYAPVRLRLTQANGDWLDQQWSATDRP